MRFETEPMNRAELAQFRRFLEEEIGTCYEINKIEGGRFYVVIFEMTAQEEDLVMEWLDRHIEE